MESSILQDHAYSLSKVLELLVESAIYRRNPNNSIDCNDQQVIRALSFFLINDCEKTLVDFESTQIIQQLFTTIIM
jgi:hypothetical protein